jgi:endonuclease YncB( thermonuclease family)
MTVLRTRISLALLGALLALSAHAETFDAKVLHVRDGDSFTVMLQGQRIRIRLVEIDAPELKQSFGVASRDSLKQLCEHKMARVIWTQKDRYGRHLGRVSCDSLDINAEQVRRGMAWVFDRYVTDRRLYLVQNAARAARLGLWQESSPMPPWEWRRLDGQGEVSSP